MKHEDTCEGFRGALCVGLIAVRHIGKAILAMVLALLVVTAPASAAPPPIKVTVTPSVGLSPLKIRVRVILGIEVKEQFVCIIIDGVDRTCLQHDSTWQGSERVIEIKNIPPGEWKVYGTIARLRNPDEVFYLSQPANLTVRPGGVDE